MLALSFGNAWVLAFLVLPLAHVLWVWARKGRRLVLPFDHGGARGGRVLSALLRVAESQSEMKPLFEKISELDMSTLQLDEATRTHIRNLDLQLERLLSEVASGVRMAPSSNATTASTTVISIRVKPRSRPRHARALIAGIPRASGR